MSTLTWHLNRLAGTFVAGVPSQSAAAAANIWAGTSGLSLVDAINVKAGLTGRTITECLNLLATGGGGGGGAANLFTSQTPSLTDVNEGAPVTVGTTVVFASNQSSTGGRFYAPATTTGTFELTLWEITADDNPAASGTGTLLANVAFGALTPGAWNSATFGSPIPVLSTKAYKYAVRSSEGRYTATGGFFNAADLVNGDITGPQTGTDPVGIGVLDNGSFIESATLYPNKTFGGNCYFVDPTIAVSGGTGTDNNKYTALDAISRIP